MTARDIDVVAVFCLERLDPLVWRFDVPISIAASHS